MPCVRTVRHVYDTVRIHYIMTREQALDRYVTVKKNIEKLRVEMEDLRKIIFGQRVQYKEPSRRLRQNDEHILRALRDHGTPISAPDLAALLEAKVTTTYGALARLEKSGFVNRTKQDRHGFSVPLPALFSLAVHAENNTKG